MRFNRTFMELKFIYIIIFAYILRRFNRTFMELKFIRHSLHRELNGVV